MENLTIRCEVEFIGGPLDGYSQSVPFPPEPFLRAAIMIEEDWAGFLRLLLDLFGCPKHRNIRMAIYELDLDTRQFVYRYVRTYLTNSSEIADAAGLIKTLP